MPRKSTTHSKADDNKVEARPKNTNSKSKGSIKKQLKTPPSITTGGEMGKSKASTVENRNLGKKSDFNYKWFLLLLSIFIVLLFFLLYYFKYYSILLYGTIIISSVSAAIASIITLFTQINYSPTERKKYPFLKKVDGNKWRLTIFIMVCGGISLTTYVIKEYVQSVKTNELSEGPSGEQILKPTLDGFRLEIKEIVAQKTDEATTFFKAGEYNFKDSSYAEAADNYEKSINIFPTMSAYLNLGICALYTSKFEKAKVSFQAGYTLSENKNDEVFRGRFLDGLGNSYEELGDTDSAINAHRKAIDIFKTKDSTQDEAYALKNLGSSLFHKGLNKESLEAYRRSLELFESVKDNLGKARLLHNLGGYYQNENLEESIKYYQQALETYEIAGNPSIRAHTLFGIGNYYYYKGEYEKALNYCLEALKIHEQFNNLLGQALTLQTIGNIHSFIQTNNQALSDYEKSYEICFQIKNPRCMFYALLSKSKIKYQQGNQDEALILANQALDLVNKSNTLPQKADVLLLIAEIYMEQEKSENSAAPLNDVLKISEITESTELKVKYLYDMGAFSYYQKDYEKAFEYGKEILKIYDPEKYDYWYASVLAMYGKIYYQQRKYNEAQLNFEKALKIFQAYKDKIAESKIRGFLGMIDYQNNKRMDAINKLIDSIKVHKENNFKDIDLEMFQKTLSNISKN